MALWKPWKEILWPFPRRGRIQTVWCTLFSNMSCTASVGRTTFVINLLITHTRMFSGNNLNKVLIESNIHDKPYKKKYISRKSSKKFTLLLISDYWGAGDLGQNGDNQYHAVIGGWSSELMHIVQWTDSSSNTFLSHFFLYGIAFGTTWYAGGAQPLLFQSIVIFRESFAGIQFPNQLFRYLDHWGVMGN